MYLNFSLLGCVRIVKNTVLDDKIYKLMRIHLNKCAVILEVFKVASIKEQGESDFSAPDNDEGSGGIGGQEEPAEYHHCI